MAPQPETINRTALPQISKTPHRNGSPVDSKYERSTSKRSVSSSGGEKLQKASYISSTTTAIRKMITPYRNDGKPPETAGPYISSSTRSVLPHVD